MTTATLNITVDLDVLHKAENAERRNGRSLSDALNEFINARASEDDSDDVVCHTPEEIRAHMSRIIDQASHD